MDIKHRVLSDGRYALLIRGTRIAEAIRETPRRKLEGSKYRSLKLPSVFTAETTFGKIYKASTMRDLKELVLQGYSFYQDQEMLVGWIPVDAEVTHGNLLSLLNYELFGIYDPTIGDPNDYEEL